MSTVVKNPSPRARFKETPAHVTKHRDMIASHEFELAADYAMLQYTSDLILAMKTPNGANFNDYATMGVKITGAKEFLQTLRMLSETPSFPETKQSDNLNHGV